MLMVNIGINMCNNDIIGICYVGISIIGIIVSSILLVGVLPVLTGLLATIIIDIYGITSIYNLLIMVLRLAITIYLLVTW